MQSSSSASMSRLAKSTSLGTFGILSPMIFTVFTYSVETLGSQLWFSIRATLPYIVGSMVHLILLYLP